MHKLPTSVTGAFLSLVIASWASAAQPNVLFIAVDDLRPQLNCYGKSFMHTPNIDRLADSGVLFERAYCMVPTCGASRASLMTSVRPSPQRFKNYLAWAEKEAPDALPLNKCFLDAGYTTISLGKVFHHATDCEDGWSKPAWRSKMPGYLNAKRQRQSIRENKETWPSKRKHNASPYESTPTEDSQHRDGDSALQASQYLEDFAKDPEQPFFLAVGFLKPHLPFNAPEKYWDMYDRDDIDLPENYYPPADAPKDAVHNSGELRAYAGIHPSKPVDRETARSMIHGYYACVSFVDAQIGILLDKLEQTGLDDNTIVCLWGDHGWQLGEHGMWNKHSCFETSMHAPLIIKAGKNVAQGVRAGSRFEGLVEFIDIYPTLCELTNIPIPSHCQGESMLGIMSDPNADWKEFAVGRFKNGDTIRSDRYRYSRYVDRKGDTSGEMLYDHERDPAENSNVSSSNPSVLAEIGPKLQDIKGK